jgi:2-polyprenyl-3-methyl-5-hydroxy-6-metoxy-1,4-benzoquinol methylase
MANDSQYGFSYYEGKVCNYGSYGGYTGRLLRLGRFLVFRKSMSMIRKYKKKGKALDIGCAYGYLTNYLNKHGFSTTGCDISEYALDIASRLFPDISTFKADIDNGVELEENNYDLITAFEVLEHCRNLDQIADKIEDSLKSEGLLLISVPDSELVPPEEQGDDTHVSFLSRDEWIDVFTKNSMECVNDVFYPGFLKKLKPYWGTNLILFRKK